MPLFFLQPRWPHLGGRRPQSAPQQEIEHGVEPTPLTDERIEGASLHDVRLDSRTILLPYTEAVVPDRCGHRLDGIGTCHPFYFCHTRRRESSDIDKKDKNVLSGLVLLQLLPARLQRRGG